MTPLFRKDCFSLVRFDESYRAEGEGLYIRLAQYCEYDYVDEPIAVMRRHTYNTGKNVDLMCEESLRWWAALFVGKDFPSELKKYKSYSMARIKRLYGLENIMRKQNLQDGRKLLIGSILEQPTRLTDPKIIAGILLTLLPEKISTSLIKAYKSSGFAADGAHGGIRSRPG